MAYPVIQYDATNGSDTAASGAGPATAVTGTDGDIATTTLTLNETKDFTGAANDGSDVLWFDGSAGDRHLFSISSFNPSVAACTSLTLNETCSASRNASNWAVGGERKTLQNDTSNVDWLDWYSGWTIEFDAGTYVTDVQFNPAATSPGYRVPPLTLRAKSGAASRPIIQQTTNNNMLRTATAHASYVCQGLKFTNDAVTGVDAHILPHADTQLTMIDCVIDTNGSGSDAAIYVKVGDTCISLIGCYVKHLWNYGLRCNQDDVQVHVEGCVFDGGGTGFRAAAIRVGGDMGTSTIRNNLIFDGDGDGIQAEPDYRASIQIVGNTIVDCSGDGITTQGTQLGGFGIIANNVIAFNGGYGLNGDTGATHIGLLAAFRDYNMYYSNTSGNYGGDASAGANDVALTADPFTNRASDDYTLNDTAGGGTACQGAGYPSSLPDGT